MKKSFIIFFNVLILSVILVSSGFSWTGKVVGVSDGDTITVLKDGHEQVKIRLYGIDSPESGQDFGTRAKQTLSDLVFSKVVEVDEIERDRYNRTVARIYSDGKDVNEALVKSGMAWVYTQYCKDFQTCSTWAELQNNAKKAGIGLWSGPSPKPPWEWRRGGNRPVSTEKVSGDLVFVAQGQVYHGNVQSRIFHHSGCRHYHCKNCVAKFTSREAAIAAGYRPCKVCRP